MHPRQPIALREPEFVKCDLCETVSASSTKRACGTPDGWLYTERYGRACAACVPAMRDRIGYGDDCYQPRVKPDSTSWPVLEL